MSNLYRLDASIRHEGSITRKVADAFQAGAGNAFSHVTHREVGTTPLPAEAWRDATLAGFVPPEAMTEPQRDARNLATVLVDELLGADAYLFAIPLYNYGVSQQAKTWVDLVLTEPRFLPGSPRLLAGRPATLVTAKGGGYGPGTPRHGWDHSTPWLLRILKDVFALEVTVLEVELTLAEVTPVMEALRPRAAEILRDAIAEAARLGEAAGLATQRATAA